MLAPQALGELTGVRHKGYLRLYGLREIATGIGILNSPLPTEWMWGRVAGDALDIATLLATATGKESGRALLATTAVAGVTALDALCATQLSAAAALEG